MARFTPASFVTDVVSGFSRTIANATGESIQGSPMTEAVPVSFVRSRWLFLRLLGAVYLIAFASLAVQITGLVGEQGILPAREFLSRVHEVYGSGAYRLLPTLVWLSPSD